MSETETSAKPSIIARIDQFSRAHNFAPKSVKIALIAICLCLLSIPTLAIRSATTASSRIVKLGLKDIGQLATQAGYFTNVQVIKGSRQLGGYDIPLTQSKYIYSYDGVIKAGLDFESIEVNVDNAKNTITVSMPEIKVQSCAIDEKSLEIYDETQNIFYPLDLSTVNLSLIKVKEEAEENAIANGILDSARSNAETLIKGFLASMYDMERYTITFE